jgi:hypothetical protein
VQLSATRLKRFLPVIFELGNDPRVFWRVVLQVHRELCPPTQISRPVILGNSLALLGQAAGRAVYEEEGKRG